MASVGRRAYDKDKFVSTWWPIIWTILVVLVASAFNWATTKSDISKLQGDVIEIKSKGDSRDKDWKDQQKATNRIERNIVKLGAKLNVNDLEHPE